MRLKEVNDMCKYFRWNYNLDTFKDAFLPNEKYMPYVEEKFQEFKEDPLDYIVRTGQEIRAMELYKNNFGR